jgi:hypothetical protein
MMPWAKWALGAWLVAVGLWAQPAGIPEVETLVPPTPQRLAAIQAAAQRDGWAPQRAPLRDAALRAYQQDKLPAAEAWANVYRWASLLGQNESEFVPRWIQAVQAAQAGHPNMAGHYETRARPLAAELSPALQAWMVGNPGFSAAFFGILQPVDYVPRVLGILSELHRADAARFKTYANLALAIAVVYDVPPPPTWPHGQVTAVALPRRLPAPADAFAWWTKQDQQGRTFHRLSRLSAEELKFVVDTPASFDELEWVQKAVDVPLGQFARTYSLVRYRNERVTKNTPIWPGDSYRLADILRTGGICPDQAYFASEAGKARGIPTLLIYGAGNDGRHAWFGFLDGSQKWQLDAGRYAEQRFVTGFARDPQTWREFSDHELQFLSERFRELPAFKQSRVHGLFAEEYLALGNARAAAIAARKAVSFERRNQPAWETLIAAARREGKDAKTIESLLHEAALAFHGFPDLEAQYVNRVAESLRARGQISAADETARANALKNKSGRTDLSVQQAREIMTRAVSEKPLPEQIRAYNGVVDTYGHGAGMTFFDEVVLPFAEHLLQLQQPKEARRAVERARQVLHVEGGSQLHREIEALLQRVGRK